MCDNQDDDLPHSIKKINLKDEKCKKCKGENGKAAILLRNDDKPLCKECFLLACTHKFRSEFGKTQIVRQGEHVLVGISGGPSSYAMLELIKEGLAESQFRKLRFNPKFVHIIENESISNEVEKALQNSTFPYFLINQSDLEDKRLIYLNEKLQNKNDTKFATCLKSAKIIVMKNVLSNLAVKHNCIRLLLATNCSRLSMRVLSNLAQGSGAASADDISFHDSNRHIVSIIQPMRGFSMKEISFLNTFTDTCFTFPPNEETGKSKTYSIDRLTEEFLASLTPNFPSTIFTISKTAEKMTYVDTKEQINRCTFCGNMYKHDGDSVSSAANALKHSMRLLAPIDCEVERNNYNNDGEEGSTLCYSCNIIHEEVMFSKI